MPVPSLEISTPQAARTWEPPPGRIVLLVAYSRFGQGHASRCLKIAKALRSSTGLEPVLVCGNPEFLRTIPDLDFATIALPPYRYVGEAAPMWDPNLSDLASPLLDVPVERLARYRGHLLRLLAERCNPAAVLIDHFPFSGTKSAEACGELIDHLRANATQTPILSGFRGLVSDRCLGEDDAAGTITTALPVLTKVFVYLDAGQRETIFDRYAFLQPWRHLFEFVGHVGPGDLQGDPPEPGLILATFGGGLDAYDRLAALCAAFELLSRRRAGLRLEIVAGRRLPRALFDRLTSSYAGEAIRILRHVDGLPRRFSAAELVVCGAGYNTLVEVCALGCGRTVSIPRSCSETSEQLRTARRFAGEGAIDMIPQAADLQPERLADRLEAVLTNPPRPRPLLDLGGTERTARRIEQIVACRLG